MSFFSTFVGVGEVAGFDVVVDGSVAEGGAGLCGCGMGSAVPFSGYAAATLEDERTATAERTPNDIAYLIDIFVPFHRSLDWLDSCRC